MTPSPSESAAADAQPVSITEDDLVTLDQLAQRVPGRWRQAGTDGSKTGILMPCQSTRFADPEGIASAAQQFKAPARKSQSRRSMVQTVEMSTTGRSAKAAYDAMLGWFGGCSDARVQLLSTHDVDRVGDDAKLLVLRNWKRPETTMLAGIARTGRATTVTFTRTQDVRRPVLASAAGLLADAVNGLCRLPDTGPCAEKPELTASRAGAGGRGAGHARRGRPPAGRRRRPPLDRHRGPRRPHQPGCHPLRRHPLRRQADEAEHDAHLRDPRGAACPTCSDSPRPSACCRRSRRVRFVAGVRTRLRTCADRELGSEVVRVTDVSTRQQDITVWHVTTEISDDESVTYLMGIVRDGGSVAQVGFVPDGKVQMAPGAFVSLVRRALERLPDLDDNS